MEAKGTQMFLFKREQTGPLLPLNRITKRTYGSMLHVLLAEAAGFSHSTVLMRPVRQQLLQSQPRPTRYNCRILETSVLPTSTKSAFIAAGNLFHVMGAIFLGGEFRINELEGCFDITTGMVDSLPTSINCGIEWLILNVY